MKNYSKAVEDISMSEKREMYNILSNYFEGTSFDGFNADLLEKERAIFIAEGDKIVGFSTFVTIKIEVEKESVYVVFSGDTIVEKEYRKSSGLAIEVAKYFNNIQERFLGKRVYYLLTTKGWRTYKVLPFFFNEFYPRIDRQMPKEIKKVMDIFCQKKYTHSYDSKKNLIIASGKQQRIRSENSYDADYPARDNRDIDFFFESNKGYLNGDELVCIASLEKENINKKLKRVGR